MASGAKYANGNYKSQQKAYNKTKHGLKIRVAANKADRKTKRNGTGHVGDKNDNSHVEKGKTRLVSQSRNRAGLGIHKRRKPRYT